MEGVQAPVKELHTLAARFEAGLLIDEAHALGVLGPEGRGIAADVEVQPDIFIGTLGKAFGISGAFAAGDQNVVSLIRNRARSYVFSTAPPPALSAATIHSLELVRAANDRRRSLLKHAKHLSTAIANLGFDVIAGGSQIIPIIVKDNRKTMDLCTALLKRGIFVQGIRPPTVPNGTARLRLTPMATHTEQHIDQVIDALRQEAMQ